LPDIVAGALGIDVGESAPATVETAERDLATGAPAQDEATPATFEGLNASFEFSQTLDRPLGEAPIESDEADPTPDSVGEAAGVPAEDAAPLPNLPAGIRPSDAAGDGQVDRSEQPAGEAVPASEEGIRELHEPTPLGDVVASVSEAAADTLQTATEEAQEDIRETAPKPDEPAVPPDVTEERIAPERQATEDAGIEQAPPSNSEPALAAGRDDDAKEQEAVHVGPPQDAGVEMALPSDSEPAPESAAADAGFIESFLEAAKAGQAETVAGQEQPSSEALVAQCPPPTPAGENESASLTPLTVADSQLSALVDGIVRPPEDEAEAAPPDEGESFINRLLSGPDSQALASYTHLPDEEPEEVPDIPIVDLDAEPDGESWD
jgi:hypothetical protein